MFCLTQAQINDIGWPWTEPLKLWAQNQCPLFCIDLVRYFGPKLTNLPTCLLSMHWRSEDTPQSASQAARRPGLSPETIPPPGNLPRLPPLSLPPKALPDGLTSEPPHYSDSWLGASISLLSGQILKCQSIHATPFSRLVREPFAIEIVCSPFLVKGPLLPLLLHPSPILSWHPSLAKSRRLMSPQCNPVLGSPILRLILN